MPVEDGDMVLMGTDGLFHNMWDEDLGTLVQSMMEELPRTDMSARAVATAVAETAHKNALDPSFRSPLSQPSAEGQVSCPFFIIFCLFFTMQLPARLVLRLRSAASPSSAALVSSESFWV